MDSQELQAWDIAQERVADLGREIEQTRLAASLGRRPLAVDNPRVVVSLLLGLASALLWLMAR